MTSMRQIVPEWKGFLSQLQQTIKEKEEGCHDEEEEDAVVYLDALPTQQHRYSCVPNYLQCLSANTNQNGSMLVGFQWGHTMDTHRMEVWTENVPGILSHSLSLPLESGYRVQHLIAVPVQRVFVGACDDLALRVFSDPFQGMSVQFKASSQGSVLSMHFCKETGELLTGSIGIIAFWGFWTSLEIQLGLLRVIDWHTSSLSRDTSINGLITERQTASLYVLCDCTIKSFDNTGRKEYRSFRGSAQGTLRSVSADWVQRYLYTGDNTGSVQVWNRDSSSLLQEFRAHSGPVSTVLVRTNTRTLLTSSLDGWVKEWNCSGDLLLKLFLDDPGGVKSLQLVNEHSVLCHCARSFSVWRLQNLYRQFSLSGCCIQRLQRLELGRGRARLLGVSRDSIVRMISPVTGELLVLSWPFLFLDKVLGFAYNPSRKELFVAGGSDEVLVLDMALSPSPAKRILRTAKDAYQEDRVTCLEAVLLAGAEWTREEPPPCLVFSGHYNGKLQLLSPHGLHCPPKKAHGGAILQMSSDPGPRPRLCCYGADGHLSVWVLEVRVNSVEMSALVHVYCPSQLVLSRLLPNMVCAVSLHYNLLFYSLASETFQRMERNPRTKISCLDCCSSLGLLAFSGPNGTVEIWESRGAQLTDIHVATPVTQICFANARGDLLVCFGGSISIIPGLQYLPLRLLQRLLHGSPVNDIMEEATPFLPRPQSSYGIAKVPRMFLRPGQATPEPTRSPRLEILREEVVKRPETGSRGGKQGALSKVVKIKTLACSYPPPLKQEDLPAPGPFAVPLVNIPKQEVIPAEAEPMEELGGEEGERALPPDVPNTVAMLRPVACDGFLPNSVLRNWPQCYLQSSCSPDHHDLLKLKALERSLSQSLRETRRGKVRGNFKLSVWHWQDYVRPPMSDSEEEEEGEEDDEEAAMMKMVASYSWLKRMPKKNRQDVLKTLMETMATMDGVVYDKCWEALLRLTENRDEVRPETMDSLAHGFLQQVQRDNPVWKRLRALRNMDQLNMLEEKDLAMIADLLLDKAAAVRQMAKFLLQQVYGIHNKVKLLERLQLYENEQQESGKHEESLLKFIEKLEGALSDDMAKTLNSSKTGRSSNQAENTNTDLHGNVLDETSEEDGLSGGETGSTTHRSADRLGKLPAILDKQSRKLLKMDDSTLQVIEEEVSVDATVKDLHKKSKTIKESENALSASHAPGAKSRKSAKNKSHLTRPLAKAADQSNDQSPTDQSTAHIQAAQSAGHNLPGQSEAHINAGQSVGYNQPGQLAAHINAGQSAADNRLGQSTVCIQLDQSLSQSKIDLSAAHLQSGQSAAHTKYGRSAVLCPPGQSTAYTQEPGQSAAQTKTDQSAAQTKTGQSAAQTKTGQSAAQTKSGQSAAQTKAGQSTALSLPGQSDDDNQTGQSVDDSLSVQLAVKIKTCQLSLRAHDKLQSQSSKDLSLSRFHGDSGIGTLSKETTLVRLPPLTRGTQLGTQLSNKMYLEPIRKVPPGGIQRDSTNWKDPLYKLISLNGFRCPRNARLAAIAAVATQTTTPESLACCLPAIRSPHRQEVPVGQRVVRKIQVRDSCVETSGSSQFHHSVPLSWQLNCHTLATCGESQYGRLQVDWIRGLSAETLRKRRRLHLPPIKTSHMLTKL